MEMDMATLVRLLLEMHHLVQELVPNPVVLADKDQVHLAVETHQVTMEITVAKEQ